MALVPLTWRVRDRLLVRFRGEDLHHDRLVIAVRAATQLTWVTPDREVHDVDTEDPVLENVQIWDGLKLPRQVMARRAYRARDSEDGEFSSGEIDAFIRDHGRPLRRVVGKRAPGAPPPSDLPALLPAPAGGHGGDGGAVPVPARRGKVGAEDDTLWAVCVGTSEVPAGSIIGGAFVKAQLADAKRTCGSFLDDKGEVGTAIKLDSATSVDALLGSLDVVRESTGGTPGAAPGLTDDDDIDVRVLPVLFEPGGDRWRTLPEAMALYFEEDMPDFPIRNVRTVYSTVKEMKRRGMTFLQHHESWVLKAGIAHSNRSTHEHKSLCRALHWFQGYDQLNLCNSAGCESLNRRRQLIETAHAGSADSPNWEAAEEYLGTKENADGSVIDPALEKQVADRMHSKSEILKQLRKAREEKEAIHAARRAAGKGGKADGKGEKPLT